MYIRTYLIGIDVYFQLHVKRLKISSFKLTSKTILFIVSLLALILTLPFITMMITGALVFKVLCSVEIKRRDRRFVQFLDSFDVFYCLENQTTTDVEGVLKSDTFELAVENIKEKLKNVFINFSTDKIFYRRNEEYGFYYWRRYSYIDLAQYVQIKEELDQTQNGKMEKFENSDQIVTYNDEGLFKVFITKNNQIYEGTKVEYKITLKFHHTVKDAAMTEFVARLIEKSEDFKVNLHSTSKSRDRESPDAIMDMITKLCDIIACSFEDSNPNQDITIERLKALEWTKSDENLLSKVKNILDLNISDFLRDTLTTVASKLGR